LLQLAALLQAQGDAAGADRLRQRAGRRRRASRIMAELSVTSSGTTLDACWSRIGTKGDGSCPELAHHIRCLNCPTFARAALLQLDRVEASEEVAQRWLHAGMAMEEVQEDQATLASALVVRIAGEWLAIATSVVQEVTGRAAAQPAAPAQQRHRRRAQYPRRIAHLCLAGAAVPAAGPDIGSASAGGGP
jgi:hypothetical protein